MCGIAGIFHCGTIKPVDPTRVERMCDVLAHRGPDGSGVWTAPGVGLGHRRLSIIDLAGSPQPMASVDGRAVISFNGEIYNYRELRRELAGLGAQFATEGDTEVILAAWQQWGADCVRRLHGMFAFAIYDQAKRTLFLARDRFGVKPLFMAHLSDGSLAFASELKGLLAHPLLRREADPLAIEDYLTWGYVPDHRSILKGVEKLPAGHWLLLEHDKPPAQPQRYWDISFAERHKGKPRDLEAELLHHLKQAVTSRMVADVPLGAFLSGGVDSSSVVAGAHLLDRLRRRQRGRDLLCRTGRAIVRHQPRRAHGRLGPVRRDRHHRGHVRRTLRRRQRAADLARVPAGARERDRGAVGRRRGRGFRRIPAAGVPRA
jgi:asparagine synthase (glutamine-hydrolysing)